MSKSFLVLSTFDERGNGHAWSKMKILEQKGFNTEFVCLKRNHADTQNFIIDGLKPNSFKVRHFNAVRLLGKIFYAFGSQMRGWYKGYDFATAKDVLRLIKRKPDYILIGSYQYFLSPKEIYKLWKKTGATIYFSMVDNKILSGGCSYPYKCNGYETGCKSCPRYPYAKFVARRIVEEKEKYFSEIPFILVGTRSDLLKAKKVSYLKDKSILYSVGVPTIPFTKNKSEARKLFNLSDDDYVIMSGAVNVNDPSKGFHELCESLNIFADKVDSHRKIVFMLLGKMVPDLPLSEKITVLKPGYLDLEGLFTAYYACDIYVSPSIEDSGPFMVNYAIACGRPVVAFNIGIALDLVITRKTGWLASRPDTEDFADGILYFYNASSCQFDELRSNCIELMENFRQKQWYDSIPQF